MIKSRLRKIAVFTNWDSKESMQDYLWNKGSWFQFDSNWEVYPSQYSPKTNPVAWKAYLLWRTYRAGVWFTAPFVIMSILDFILSVFGYGNFATFKFIGGEFSGNNILIAIGFYIFMFWSMKNALLLENAYFFVFLQCAILGHNNVMEEIGKNPKNHQQIRDYKANRSAHRKGMALFMLGGFIAGLLFGRLAWGGGDEPQLGVGRLRLDN